jgi:hypothetical protein
MNIIDPTHDKPINMHLLNDKLLQCFFVSVETIASDMSGLSEVKIRNSKATIRRARGWRVVVFASRPITFMDRKNSLVT